MKEPSPIGRQATFNTGLAESEFLLDKPHGSIHRPVVKERDIKVTSLHGTQAYLKNTKAANQNIHVNSNDVHSDIVSPETVPSISLSVRNKVKKKPRIRVPHLDFSTQEPTIEEETTQDLLFVQRATSKELNQDLTPRSIRSNTIIVTSPKFRKSSSLTLIPRETPDGRKKRSHEVTIINVGSLNKTHALADSKSSNEILEYDHRTLKSINQTTTKTPQNYHKTTTRKPNRRNDQNSLVNQNTDFQAKNHFSRQNTDQEGDSDQHKSIRGNLISGKITQDSQFNSKDKTSKRQNLSTDMEESRKYVSEHETFEEVLQDRNSLLKSETTYHKRIRQLEDELKAIVLQCQTLSEENKKLREKLDKLKQENPEIKKQIASLVAENSNLNSQNEELRKKVTTLEKQLNLNSKHESRISELESNNDALDSRVAELQKENNALKLKVTSLEDKNQIISTTLQEKRKENNDLMRAIKDAPALETKLRESNFKLEEAQRELETIKHDLNETSRLLKNSEQTSEKLKESISEKDSEIAEMRKDRENDRQTIAELKNNVDKSRHELKKYVSKNQSYKDLEIKAAGLKSKITSLRAHVESIAGENSKLKQEREEMQRQVERLNEVCSSANAAADSKKYFKKWQSERDARMKAENEIIQKEKESRSIEKRLKETEQTIQELQKRIHSLEEENEKLKSRDTKDLTSDNNTLKEENKKLRQMLVERNIELTNKKAEIENEEGEGQILYLERKSHLAKVGVHTVSVWSKDEHETRKKGKGFSVSFAGADKHAVKKKFKNKDSQNSKDISPKSHTEDVPKSHSADLSPRTVKRNPLRPSAKDDASEAVKRTSLNLPQIDASSSDTLSEHQAGYFNLYREKLKRKNGRRY
ncbi:myosin-8 [Biomphalaria pfeifferi]|uniref:Myosin-8 n=1 Tax=Biomphalaria pfeifferi TaxID=112525 RepID=A0AAD8FAT5_BIOPF|nr:myosin-8 [Biomphalaria pfeifferi]